MSRSCRTAWPTTTLAILLLGSAPSPTRAWCRMTTASTDLGCSEDGIPLAWKRRCIAMSVDMQRPAGLTDALVIESVDHALDAWSGVRCGGGVVELTLGRDRQPARCQQAEFSLEDGNVSVIAFVEDWSERDLDPLAYALTTVWHDRTTGEILDADVLVNATRGPFTRCPEPNGCQPDVDGLVAVDLANTLTHEMGHVLGLSHSEDPEATMAREAPRGEVRKRTLAPDDVSGLCAAYPPGSLPEACDFTPYGGFDVNCTDEPCREGCCCRIDRASAGGSREPLAALLPLGLVLWLARRRRPTARRAPR